MSKIKQALGVLAKATPGPYHIEDSAYGTTVTAKVPDNIPRIVCFADCDAEHDAKAIALALNVLPEALAEIQAWRELGTFFDENKHHNKVKASAALDAKLEAVLD